LAASSDDIGVQGAFGVEGYGVIGEGRAAMLVGMLARIAFFAGGLAVTVLCLLPVGALPPVQLWDKLEHMIAYAALAATGCLGFTGSRSRIIIVVSLLALGIAIELAQSLVPGRDTSAADLLANGLGIIAGIGLARLFAAIVFRPRPSPV
jgi:VanZ family protein